jgi:hypothetical protein
MPKIVVAAMCSVENLYADANALKVKQEFAAKNKSNKDVKLTSSMRDLFAVWMGNIRFIRDSHGEVSGFVLDNQAIQNFRFEKDRLAAPSK